MNAKTKTFTALALLMTVIIVAACTPKVSLPVLREAPDFALTNQDGLEVRLSDFRGKVVIMDFIYTFCPDVCGMLNDKLKVLHADLAEGLKQDLILVSISFDPEFDTPEMLKQWAIKKRFDVPGWQFLTGTVEQIRQVTDDYGVVYKLVEASDHEDGSSHEHVRGFTHNIMVVLIDRNGMVRKTYGHAFSPVSEMVDDVTSLLE